MPPRKRARVSQAASPTPTSQPKTPAPAESASSRPEEQLLNDAWTDEEEIALFKGLIRWKPTGIHKHFHLLALHQYMLDSGHIHPRNEHTKPAGIWRKLQTLYNLEALDEREDARQLEKLGIPDTEKASSNASDDEDEDVYSEAANKIENEDFDLPGDEFAERKWMQRLATEKQRKDESPPMLPELNMADEAPVRFTPSFSIEPSEAATPVSRRGRPRAGTGGARGRGAATTAAGARRSLRQVESVAGEQEEDGGDEEVGEEEDGDEEEEEESQQSTPARRGTRSAKETRSRAAPKSKTRSRARGR